MTSPYGVIFFYIIIFEIIINLESLSLFKMLNFNNIMYFSMKIYIWAQFDLYMQLWRHACVKYSQILGFAYIVTFYNINLVRIPNLRCLHHFIRKLLRKFCFSPQGSRWRHPCGEIFKNHNVPPAKSVVHIYTFMIQS